MKFFMIALGGATGALLRYLLSGLVYKFITPTFPWGTLFVNVLGSYFMGLLTAYSNVSIVSSNLKSLVLIGLIGAFTTFSTFMLETYRLFQDNEIKLALYYLIFSNIIGLCFLFLGFVSVRLILR